MSMFRKGFNITVQKTRTWAFLLFITVILSLSYAQNGASAASSSATVIPHKYAALIMDAETGIILHQENANKSLHPASLTKLMTLLLTFEALENGSLHLNDRVKISKYAASMVPSKLGLKPGSTIRVKDAIYALVTKSANDIAVALAEKLGRTERGFAWKMTRKARSLGMQKTRFVNASGLHSPRQVSSARDMAILARTLINEYEQYYHFFSTKTFHYAGKTYRSHNRLMDTYAGMDGMKTGYIQASGFNLVSSVSRHDKRIIGVIFGGKTAKSRNARMKQLLDLSFEKIKDLRIARHTVPLPQRKPNRDVVVALHKPESAATFPSISHRVNLGYKDKDNGKSAAPSRWAILDALEKSPKFTHPEGEGDYENSLLDRVETGLIAISAHTGDSIPNHITKKGPLPPRYISPPLNQDDGLPRKRNLANKTTHGNWSVQVGAFSTRERANKALSLGLASLPDDLKHARATIAPRKISKGWIYRSKLQGFSKEAAHRACSILNDCITLAPAPQ